MGIKQEGDRERTKPHGSIMLVSQRKVSIMLTSLLTVTDEVSLCSFVMKCVRWFQ